MKTAGLLRPDRARFSDLVAEFLHRSAGSNSPEEEFCHAGACLRQLFGADAVHLWRGDIDRRRLRRLAGPGVDVQLFEDLGGQILPGFERVTEQGEPLWVDNSSERGNQMLAVFLDAQSLLVLPAAVRGQTLGCLFVLHHRKSGSMLDPHKLAVGSAVAHSVGLLLHADAAERRLRAVEGRLEAVARRKEDIHRTGWSRAGLDQFAAEAQKVGQAEAVGFYECGTRVFRRVAAVGSSESLPPELPRGEADAYPWEQALNSGGPVRVEVEEWLCALGPGPPRAVGVSLPRILLPLKARGYPLGLMVLCGPRAEMQDVLFNAELLELAYLATASLESRQLRELNEREHRRYLQVFEQSETGILFLSPRGEILDVNRALLQRTGYALHELAAKPLKEFLHPADWEPLSAWLEHRTTPAFSRVVLWKTMGGAWQEWSLSLRATGASDEAGLVGFLRSTSQDRALNERWRAAEVRLQTVLDSVHDGVWLISPEGTVERANHRLGQLFSIDARELGPGASQIEVIERLAGSFRAPEEAKERWLHLERHPEEVRWEEVELVHPRRRVLERFARPVFDSQGRLLARLEIYSDITARRFVDDKILHRERLASLGQMVSGIAHELNNPLTAVSGYARLLLEGHPPRHLRAAASNLSREAERAGRIAKSLLLFGRADQAEKRPTDLGDVIDRVLSLRAYELKLHNIEVRHRSARSLPPVLADPHRLQQAFLNLILNAEQAIRSQRTYGRITISTGRIGLEEVHADIADDGPGIDPAVLPHIFDAFFTTKPALEGTGLGLAMADSIVKENGGEIRVQSTPGRGATFRLVFPVYRAATEPDFQPATDTGVVETVEGAPRVLVVDDEVTVAYLMADVVRRQGCRVRVYTQSDRALQAALQESFDLIICDLRMPGLDGRAFHRILSERSPDLARRLLFTTGDTLAPDTRAFLHQVQLPHVPKPFTVEELRSAVKEWFSRRGQPALPRSQGQTRKPRNRAKRKPGSPGKA